MKTLEENFERLDEITGAMEKEDLTLEEMFEYYKEGVQLVKESGKMIDTVEKEMIVLSQQEKTSTSIGGE